MAASLFARPGENFASGSHQNPEVQLQTPPANVFEVESYPIVEIANVIPATDLPQACDAGLNRQLLFLIIREPNVLRNQWRPRADKAHVTLEHAVDLWQFVQAVTAEKTTEPGHSRIVREFEHRSRHFIQRL